MRRLLETALVALIVVCAAHFLLLNETKNTGVVKESVLERVTRTKKLKCAYWLWPDLVERDPNSGAMNGPIVDIIKKVAEDLNAEVQWTAEASIDSYVTLLNSGKVDAVCGPLTPGPFLRAHAHFVAPVFYSSSDVYVQFGEKKFESSREDMNVPEVSFLSLDGAATKYFAMTFFPKAKHNALPAVVGAGQPLLDVQSGKADATISEQLVAARFLERNPNSLMRLRWNDKPLITLGVTPFATKFDDVIWANTLDNIIKDLLDFGEVEKILSEHGLVAGVHYSPIASPYQIQP
ncbi:MAG TPA: hypothetical protein DD400_01215 [Rhodospirillaceae bacterium]|nr:hypothetical protein [Rhodospirillaceae bacterium]